MKALRIYAGPKARRHIEQNGLQPRDIGVVPGAAGGPKGLILGALDRFIFGNWLAKTDHPVHLVGASIGAWRMATACLNDPAAGFTRLEHDYIHQHYELQPGQKRPTADFVSEQFGQSLKDFYGGRVHEVLQHPRYKLHIVTSRGRHLLGREHKLATPLGYLGAFLTNSLHRKAMGAWLERVVFSTPDAKLPFATSDYRTRQVDLSEDNFKLALQASCSIPFVLRSVHNVPGGPPGAYWDGGITDYHLHLNYANDLSAGGARPGALPPLPEIRGARLARQGPQMAPQGHALPRQHGAAGARPGLDQAQAAQRQTAGSHGLCALWTGFTGQGEGLERGDLGERATGRGVAGVACAAGPGAAGRALSAPQCPLKRRAQSPRTPTSDSGRRLRGPGPASFRRRR
jgi:hypothetical protein